MLWQIPYQWQARELNVGQKGTVEMMKDAISRTVDYWLDMMEHPEKYCQVTHKLTSVCEHCKEFEILAKQGELYQRTGDVKSFLRRL